MPHTPETPVASIESRLSEIQDIQDEAKKNKVELTPEVREYIRNHIEAVQQKLSNREEVTEDDMKFMQDVRMWVRLPDVDRKNFVEIDGLSKNGELIESVERKINLKQWLDLLHVAKAKKKDRKWINETFRFPGGGKIETDGDLDLINCTSLTSLPAGLEVGGNLLLTGCTSLTALPTSLKVGLGLYLEGCTALTTLPSELDVYLALRLAGCTSLTSLPIDMKVHRDLILEGCTALTTLPDGLRVGGGALTLKGCTSLTSLPAELKVDENLILEGCTSLASLPTDLKVGEHLYLSDNLHEQVKKDAERLEKEGKIKGEIRYQ